MLKILQDFKFLLTILPSDIRTNVLFDLSILRWWLVGVLGLILTHGASTMVLVKGSILMLGFTFKGES